MPPKLQIAAVLLLCLLPLWITVVVQDMSKKKALALAVVAVLVALVYRVGGFRSAIVAVAGGYLLLALGVGVRFASAKWRRKRLLEGSSPSDLDVWEWALRVLKDQGWTVKPGASLRLTRVAKESHTEFQFFCAADWEKIPITEMKGMVRLAAAYRPPTLLLIVGGAPAALVGGLRRCKIFPVSPMTFVDHLGASQSRGVFLKSCREAQIEDRQFRVAPSLYAGIGLE